MCRQTRVTFDTNFLNRFRDAPELVRARILRCVDLGALEVFVNYEVLREAMGFAQSRDPDRLIPRAADILRLAQGRFINPLQPLLESEARGRLELAMDEELRDQIVEFLEQAAGGHVPSAALKITLDALSEKKQARLELQQYVDVMKDIPPDLPKEEQKKLRAELRERLEAMTFDDVRRSWVGKYGVKYLDNHFRAWGIPQPASLAADVFGHPEAYPRLHLWMSMQALPAYRYRGLGEGKQEGDLFDLRQLVYLHDCDVYVTDDDRATEWFRDVFGASRRIITAEAFFRTKWCRCALCWSATKPLRGLVKWVRERHRHIKTLEGLDILANMGMEKPFKRITKRVRRWLSLIRYPE